jgi:hypothetical protein
MRKWIKFFIAIALLPFCAACAKTLWWLLVHSGSADRIWMPLLAGVACWLTIFLLLPKPMWIYVMGHELTHAVWTWLCGGSVREFKATSKGGQVRVTKNNFLISLAPYFFPIYAVLVVIVFVIGNAIWNWHAYRVWFHLILGAAWAFHVTLTFHILKMRQTDITEEGYVFSAVIIFLGNAAVFLIGWPLLMGSGHLTSVANHVFAETAWMYRWLAMGIRR